VVVHFVTEEWELEKRIIGFRLIDVPHFGANITDRTSIVLSDYQLNNKVLSITLDNASANASAMDVLTPSIPFWFVASSL
jgi:hypothetical protein